MSQRRLHPSDPTSWIIMPQISERIAKFAIDEYGACPPFLIRDVWIHWLTQVINPEQARMAIWARIEENGHVSGHILAEICTDHGTPFLGISQAASDKGYPFDPKSNKQAWSELEEWGRSFGCKEVRTLAVSPAVARLDRRLYGLQEVAGHIPLRKGIANE